LYLLFKMKKLILAFDNIIRSQDGYFLLIQITAFRSSGTECRFYYLNPPGIRNNFSACFGIFSIDFRMGLENHLVCINVFSTAWICSVIENELLLFFLKILYRARIMVGEESAQNFHINVYGNAPPVSRNEERIRDD